MVSPDSPRFVASHSRRAVTASPVTITIIRTMPTANHFRSPSCHRQASEATMLAMGVKISVMIPSHRSPS